MDDKQKSEDLLSEGTPIGTARARTSDVALAHSSFVTRPPNQRTVLEEGQRQLVLLALAELALSRPGFDWTLGEIADLFFGREMFEGFKRSNADRVKASHGPFGFAPAGGSKE